MAGVGESIMVSALTGVMRPLLVKLTNLMGAEYAKFKGVRKKLESLTKELIAINVMLEKYSAMEKPDVQVKAWMKEVRELAYDMEDRIDLFTYHVDHEPADKSTGFKGLLRKSIRKVKKIHHRYKFANQMQELQHFVNEVFERQTRYQIGESSSREVHTEIDPRLTALYVEKEKLVGMERPIMQLIDRFVNGDPTKNRRIVSIVGPGGSGKTTLANQLYQRIKDRFEFKAFVSVSQTPNIKNILKILLSATDGRHVSSEQMGSYGEQQLIDKLREYLQERRYIIVVDDIWNKLAWQNIQCNLPKNDHPHVIITTTRIKSIVAEDRCTSNEEFVYPMESLSRSESRKLFLMRAFNEDKCPDHLEEVMNEILYKCDGLPLAIVTLASLLAKTPRVKEEWKRVLTSIRSIDGKDEELEVMDMILNLSYRDLPHNLKSCLLYFSIFQEDSEIPKDVLVWRWIAEGFIGAKQGYALEEIGESYFNELINRSLIQPVWMRGYGHQIKCRVHDIVLDFIISRSTEENFTTSLVCDNLPSPHRRIRRVPMRDTLEGSIISQGALDLSHLRCLSIRPVGERTTPPVFYLHLPVLRVLDLVSESGSDADIDPDDLLKNIGSLFHLKYLLVYGSNIHGLPVQIGKQEFLQTLDLRGTKIRELPESVVHLKRLVRLFGDGLQLPHWFGNMESLQEVWAIDGSNSFMNWRRFRQLRVLGICFYPSKADYSSFRRPSSVSLQYLHGSCSVYIYNNKNSGHTDSIADSWYPPQHLQTFVSEGSEDWLSRLPKWIDPSFSKLTELNFSLQRTEREDLHKLGELPSLMTLKLMVHETPEGGHLIDNSGFPCLINLDFCNIFGVGLRFQEGAMRKLQYLVLGFDVGKAQSAHGSFGCGIRHLSSVQKIKIRARSDVPVGVIKADMISVINEEIELLQNRPVVTFQILQ